MPDPKKPEGDGMPDFSGVTGGASTTAKTKTPAVVYETYTVKPGDSLSKIAKRTLGSTRRWPELFAANRDKVSNPRFIRVGQTLVLPSHDAPMAAAGATYIVRRGDCLFSIASAQLGAGTKWKSIWQMNKDRVRDARFIYPGQRLTLPRA